jgi:hypothetical protein
LAGYADNPPTGLDFWSLWRFSAEWDPADGPTMVQMQGDPVHDLVVVNRAKQWLIY